jgi:hypothetical protein
MLHLLEDGSKTNPVFHEMKGFLPSPPLPRLPPLEEALQERITKKEGDPATSEARFIDGREPSTPLPTPPSASLKALPSHQEEGKEGRTKSWCFPPLLLGSRRVCFFLEIEYESISGQITRSICTIRSNCRRAPDHSRLVYIIGFRLAGGRQLSITSFPAPPTQTSGGDRRQIYGPIPWWVPLTTDVRISFDDIGETNF